MRDSFCHFKTGQYFFLMILNLISIWDCRGEKGHDVWTDSVHKSVWHRNRVYNCSISQHDVSFISILHSVLDFLLVCDKGSHVYQRG